MPTERPDLAEHLYWIRSPAQCGFQIYLPTHDAAGRLDLVARRRDRDLARLSTTYIAPYLEDQPLPPEDMTQRVSDLAGESFRLSGLSIFTDLWDRVSERLGDPRDLAILDWGCGCGRVSRYLARAGVTRLFGCDIDAEAISWCSSNLRGEFRLSAPEPRLPFGDSEVDTVLAVSVLTHLDRQRQRQWLAELRRVLSPQGLLVASVAGPHAYALGNSRIRTAGHRPGSAKARAVLHARRWRLRRAKTIQQDDPHFDGIAPTGFYKSIFQSRAYTQGAWGEHFSIESYIERGLAGHQDLVVMKPRPLDNAGPR